MTSGAMYQIGEVAELVGLSLRTIRYYEEAGLVMPARRTSGGVRLYTEEAIDRLQLIKQMKPLDFRLEEMRQLLEARERLAAGVDDDDERDRLLERLDMFATAGEQRSKQLRQQLEITESFAAELRLEVSRARNAARAAR